MATLPLDNPNRSANDFVVAPTISSDVLNPTPPIDYKTPNPTPIIGADPASVLSLTKPEIAARDTSQDIQKLNDQTVGESAYRAQQEQTQGIPALTKDQNDLSARLKALQSEALAIPLQFQNDAQGRGQTAAGVQPLSAAALRENAIKSLSVSSLLEASRGNLTLAQENVDRAVKQKYDPIKEEIAAKTANLNLILNSPERTVADKTRAQQQLDLQNKKADQIDKAKEDTKTIMSWVAAALANGASQYQADAISRLAQGDNPDLQSAFRLYAPFAKDPQATQKALLELEKTRADIALTKANTAKLNKEAADIGVPPITNPDAGKYAGALSIILGSGKFTKDQKASVIASVNGGDDPFTVVKNQAKNLLGQTGDTKLTGYEVAKEQLTSVQDALQRYYAAGGNTSFLTGNYESVVNKLGNVNDPKLVSLATQIAASLQIYRNAVSGTAYSVQEGKDIASIFPGINKTEGLNKAILAGRMQAFDSTIDSTYRSVLGKTYDDLKAAQGTVAGASTQTLSVPKGQTTTINGHTYVSDGTQWVLK